MKCLIVQVLIVFTYIGKSMETYQQEQEYEQHSSHQKKPIIPILKYNFEQHDKGYQYSYEAGNGIHAQETGFIKNKGDEKHETIVKQGTVTYHDEHGHPITLTYIADEHGFQPQGSHLPTPPPIPEEIQREWERHRQQMQVVPEEQQNQGNYEGQGHMQLYVQEGHYR